MTPKVIFGSSGGQNSKFSWSGWFWRCHDFTVMFVSVVWLRLLIIRTMSARGGFVTCSKVSIRVTRVVDSWLWQVKVHLGLRGWFLRESVRKLNYVRINMCMGGEGYKDVSVAADEEEGDVSAVSVVSFSKLPLLLLCSSWANCKKLSSTLP